SELQEALAERLDGPVLIEVRTKKGARKDLGRPKESPAENKNAFMEFIK
ncbi:MAG TPA: phosphonopyruvate decarboxylase, partial [Treponemataceae bacterium]|nr:phosphonopyruvate decarboxylase [Treponemataceae bacterium]